MKWNRGGWFPLKVKSPSPTFPIFSIFFHFPLFFDSSSYEKVPIITQVSSFGNSSGWIMVPFRTFSKFKFFKPPLCRGCLFRQRNGESMAYQLKLMSVDACDSVVKCMVISLLLECSDSTKLNWYVLKHDPIEFEFLVIVGKSVPVICCWTAINLS